MLNGVCVPAHTVSRPSSHSASAACGSIGTCAALGVRKASSTTTSASSNPVATSPVSSRKRWQTFVPGSGRTPIETASCAESAASGCSSGAPGATACDRVEDGGQLLVVDLDQPRRRPARRRAVGAATAATTSPTWRATSASTRWSRAWQP